MYRMNLRFDEKMKNAWSVSFKNVTLHVVFYWVTLIIEEDLDLPIDRFQRCASSSFLRSVGRMEGLERVEV